MCTRYPGYPKQSIVIPLFLTVPKNVQSFLIFSLQIHAPSKPRNMAMNDPEVVEVAPAMFAIPAVSYKYLA